MTDDFAERRPPSPHPRAKMGQTARPRRQGGLLRLCRPRFDVDVGPLFQTPEETAKMAIENDVHDRHEPLAAGHRFCRPGGRTQKQGRPHLMVFCGGVISQDYDFLREHGAVAIFGPGTNIPEASKEIMEALNEQYAD
ncbi:hypothetical protein [Akkermansia sp.]|uniref:hypothetical protein n=1 Tax=Akkermansia sp. TaxID=1872421 RepID=UPI00399446CC